MLAVRDIMTTDVVTVTPESTIREVMETLSTNHLSGAPVVTGNRVVGVISTSDILSFIVNAPEPETTNAGETVVEAWKEPVPDPDDDEELESAISQEMLDEWSQGADSIVDDTSPSWEDASRPAHSRRSDDTECFQRGAGFFRESCRSADAQTRNSPGDCDAGPEARWNRVCARRHACGLR